LVVLDLTALAIVLRLPFKKTCQLCKLCIYLLVKNVVKISHSIGGIQ